MSHNNKQEVLTYIKQKKQGRENQHFTHNETFSAVLPMIDPFYPD